MKILLVADGSHFFLSKYLQAACSAFVERDHKAFVLCSRAVSPGAGPSMRHIDDEPFNDLCRERSPERFRRMFELAREVGAERIHLCFFDDAPALRQTIIGSSLSGLELSVSIFGLGAFRNDNYERAYNDLVSDRQIARTLVHSNNPDATAAAANAMGILDRGNVRFLHDPIYDDPHPFKQDKLDARKALDIDPSTRVVLYYGTFGRKKGADMLLQAARHSATRNVSFLFAGSLATSEPGFLCQSNFALPRVRLDDRIVDERDTARYFRSADLVAMPYGRHYEFDTSGVFIQSCLAERPIIAPNVTPFRETVERYGLGYLYRCNDALDLAHCVDAALHDDPTRTTRRFGAYLAGHSTWADFACTVLS